MVSPDRLAEIRHGLSTNDSATCAVDTALLRLADHCLHGLVAADLVLAPRRFRPPITYRHEPRSAHVFRDAEAALAWLRGELPNLVALCLLSAERRMYEQCWQLAFLLRGLFFLDKLWDQWIETHTAALAAARATGNRWAQGVTLNNLGIAHIDRGEVDLAQECYREALAVFTDLGDEHGRISAVANLGWAHHYRGEHDVALRELRAAAEYYLHIGARHNAAITLRGIALVETELAAYTDAVTHATEARDTFEDMGLHHDAAMAVNCLGWAHFRSGRHAEADIAYRRAVTLGERIDSRHEVARAETGLGNVAAAEGRRVDALRYWRRAESRATTLNPAMVGEARARLTAESRVVPQPPVA
jgi:tetratricopeptide (TPR) repeat protein